MSICRMLKKRIILSRKPTNRYYEEWCLWFLLMIFGFFYEVYKFFRRFFDEHS